MDRAEMTEREQAELLVLGLELGLVTASDVVAWADAIIERTDRPHWALCELSSMSRAHVPELVAMLKNLPGEVDQARVRFHWLQSVAATVEADPRGIDQLVVRVLRIGAIDDDDLERAIRIADYELELLESGVSRETRVTIARTFAASLRAAAKRMHPTPY